MPDILFTTKLYIAQPYSKHIPYTALIERLNKSLPGNLILIAVLSLFVSHAFFRYNA